MVMTSRRSVHSVVAIALASILSCVSVVLSGDGDFQQQQPPKDVWAAAGSDAMLPCDVTAPRGDRVNMVLWFKDTTGVPLYSLDARQKALSSAVHWSIATPLGSRAYFISGNQGSAHLLIKDVRLEDEGIFRCRVDFVSSPTRNFGLNLTVIEAPMPPLIFDGQGREVIGAAGPYLEGYELYLACHVTSGQGRRKIEVSWWMEDRLLDSLSEVTSDTLTINRLYIPAANRTMFDRHLQCRARNSNLAPAVVREVPLDIYLKPLTVNILTENVLLSAGKTHTLKCESTGSVPPARVVWLLDGEPIRKSDAFITETYNSTTSTLSLTPFESDHGKELVCRAENSRFIGGMLEERRHIQVAYAPIVSIHYETNTDEDDLKEGDDAILVCEIQANPQPRRITWFHEDEILLANVSSGVLSIERTLRLTPLTREMAGEYACAASNEEGATRSEPLFLRVQYAPRCREGQESVRAGALVRQTVTVQCEVEADPGAEDVRFSWTYNRSRDVFPIPGFRVTSAGVTSKLDYTVTSENDYGTLACWASNSVGRQTTPCYIHLVPPALPHPPENCVVRNRSSGGLEVACEPGFNGELPQHFMLEVSETMAGLPPLVLDPPLYHVLGSEPVFSLHSLEPGQHYQVAVYAVNAKGMSDPPVVISHITVPETMEKLTGPDTTEVIVTTLEPVMIVIVVLVGVAVLIVCLICTTLQVVRRRQASTRKAEGKTRNQAHDDRLAYARRRERSESIEMQKREMARWSGYLDEGGGTGFPQFYPRNEPDLIFSRNEVYIRND